MSLSVFQGLQPLPGRQGAPQAVLPAGRRRGVRLGLRQRPAVRQNAARVQDDLQDRLPDELPLRRAARAERQESAGQPERRGGFGESGEFDGGGRQVRGGGARGRGGRHGALGVDRYHHYAKLIILF